MADKNNRNRQKGAGTVASKLFAAMSGDVGPIGISVDSKVVAHDHTAALIGDRKIVVMSPSGNHLTKYIKPKAANALPTGEVGRVASAVIGPIAVAFYRNALKKAEYGLIDSVSNAIATWQQERQLIQPLAANELPPDGFAGGSKLEFDLDDGTKRSIGRLGLTQAAFFVYHDTAASVNVPTTDAKDGSSNLVKGVSGAIQTLFEETLSTASADVRLATAIQQAATDLDKLNGNRKVRFTIFSYLTDMIEKRYENWDFRTRKTEFAENTASLDLLKGLLSAFLIDCFTFDAELRVKINSNDGSVSKLSDIIARLSRALPLWMAPGSSFITKIASDRTEDESKNLNVRPFKAAVMDAVGRALNRSSSITSIPSIITALMHITNMGATVLAFYKSAPDYFANAKKHENALLMDYRNMLSKMSLAGGSEMADVILKEFIDSKIFTESIAGLLYSMAKTAAQIDSSLLQDWYGALPVSEIISSFNTNIGGEIISLNDSAKILPVPTYNHLGASYSLKYHLDTDVTITPAGITSAGGFSFDNVSTFSKGDDSALMKSVYAMLAMHVLSSPTIRSEVLSGSKAALYTEYSFNVSAKESMMATLKSVDVAIQFDFALFREANKAWIAGYLCSILDVLDAYKLLLTHRADDAFVIPRKEKIDERHSQLRDGIAKVLKALFPRLNTQPTGLLPVLRVNGTSNPEEIIRIVSDMLLNNTVHGNLLAEIETLPRLYIRDANTAIRLSNAARVVDLKDSSFTWAGEFLETAVVESERMHVNEFVKMIDGTSISNTLHNTATRLPSLAVWNFYISVDDLVLGVQNGNFKPQPAVSAALVGRHTATSSVVPEAMMALVKRGYDSMVNTISIVSELADLRLNRIYEQYDRNFINMLTLASNAMEGVEVGLSPQRIDLMTNSNETTMEQIFSAINLAAGSKVTESHSDIAVLVSAMQHPEHSAFPFTLSERYLSLVAKAGSEEAKLQFEKLTLEDMLSLKDSFSATKGGFRTISIYKRERKAIELLVKDTLVESNSLTAMILPVNTAAATKLNLDTNIYALNTLILLQHRFTSPVDNYMSSLIIREGARSILQFIASALNMKQGEQNTKKTTETELDGDQKTDKTEGGDA